MLRLKLQYFVHLMQRTDSLEKDPDAGKDWSQEEKGMTEDEMVGWHHRLDGHEFEETLGDGEGQGSLAYCSQWGCKEDTTERLNWTELIWLRQVLIVTNVIFSFGRWDLFFFFFFLVEAWKLLVVACRI